MIYQEQNQPVDFIGADVNLIYALRLFELGSHLLHHGGKTVRAFSHHHSHLVAPTNSELVLPVLLALIIMVCPTSRQRARVLLMSSSKKKKLKEFMNIY